MTDAKERTKPSILREVYYAAVVPALTLLFIVQSRTPSEWQWLVVLCFGLVAVLAAGLLAKWIPRNDRRGTSEPNEPNEPSTAPTRVEVTSAGLLAEIQMALRFGTFPTSDALVTGLLGVLLGYFRFAALESVPDARCVVLVGGGTCAMLVGVAHAAWPSRRMVVRGSAAFTAAWLVAFGYALLTFWSSFLESGT